MAKAKEVKLKYIPTGVVFTMPLQDALETIKTDRGNFEAVNFKVPKEKEVIETTTYEQVVEEDNKTEEPEAQEAKIAEQVVEEE